MKLNFKQSKSVWRRRRLSCWKSNRMKKMQHSMSNTSWVEFVALYVEWVVLQWRWVNFVAPNASCIRSWWMKRCLWSRSLNSCTLQNCVMMKPQDVLNVVALKLQKSVGVSSCCIFPVKNVAGRNWSSEAEKTGYARQSGIRGLY